MTHFVRSDDFQPSPTTSLAKVQKLWPLNLLHAQKGPYSGTQAHFDSTYTNIISLVRFFSKIIRKNAPKFIQNTPK